MALTATQTKTPRFDPPDPAEVKVYYGTKRIKAWPAKGIKYTDATPEQLDQMRRERIADGKDPDAERYPAVIGVETDGMAVEYADGYRSWSPLDAFEAAYRPSDAMDFSGALAAMKDGASVRRGDWGGGQFIQIEASVVRIFVDSKVEGEFFPMSVHLLADDWQIVEESSAA